MKKVIFFLSIVFIALSSFTTLHKFYVSVTQIEYDEEQKSLQIISRIFIDDMEDVLRERYDESIELVSEKEPDRLDEYIFKYLSKKLLIIVNGEEVRFTFIGKEYENDLIICYLEVENIPSLEKIEVSNQVLMDFFEEQQNIIHVKKGKKRKSLILEKERDIGVLKFSK
ncbi:DUF6702 family protein [Aquimarina sp. RZ0]|uniref:DUF6702 family protein n=1 Tax=Aquimarina sp. RZ0 TaxID=2607730 RepID=UPI0011F191C8|nr:DUF6702 family protein [Aquimarina sp. RZ0]KAA1247145.1 hypothetical protein F0000_04350 [Aquimarina sp. RZ0]